MFILTHTNRNILNKICTAKCCLSHFKSSERIQNRLMHSNVALVIDGEQSWKATQDQKLSFSG